jgi:hypothetical protein
MIPGNATRWMAGRGKGWYWKEGNQSRLVIPLARRSEDETPRDRCNVCTPQSSYRLVSLKQSGCHNYSA